MYSQETFERSSGCILQFPSTEILPVHNFQSWDCCALPVSLILRNRGGLVNGRNQSTPLRQREESFKKRECSLFVMPLQTETLDPPQRLLTQ